MKLTPSARKHLILEVLVLLAAALMLLRRAAGNEYRRYATDTLSYVRGRVLEVVFPEDLLARVPEIKREALKGVLAHDPRPSYQKDPERVYGLAFGGVDVKFTVREDILTVQSVEQTEA